jgi:hypothetical protein
MLTKTLLLAPAVLLVLGCAPGSEHLLGLQQSPPITTDRATYELAASSIGWETTIGFTFTNPRADAVYLVNCRRIYAIVLEKEVEGRWVPGWGNITPQCLSPAIEVQPGATWTDQVHVFAGLPGSNNRPQFAFEHPQGTYRLVLEPLVSFDPDRYPFGPSLPLEQRISNSFDIIAP